MSLKSNKLFRLVEASISKRLRLASAPGTASPVEPAVAASEHQKIYERFREFTMIPPATFVDNLCLAEKIREIPGCIVECGVWRGGMSGGIASLLGPERRYILCDSFEGLPPARSIDGQSALDWQADKDSTGYHDNCAAPPAFAEAAMKRAGATSFALVKGWFEATLPQLTVAEPIALLRLDADWYDSTMTCLDHLFDRVAAGGLIVIDDYFFWDGCSRALHDFLSKRSAVERIQHVNHVCFLQKCALRSRCGVIHRFRTM